MWFNSVFIGQSKIDHFLFNQWEFTIFNKPVSEYDHIIQSIGIGPVMVLFYIINIIKTTLKKIINIHFIIKLIIFCKVIYSIAKYIIIYSLLRQDTCEINLEKKITKIKLIFTQKP